MNKTKFIKELRDWGEVISEWIKEDNKIIRKQLEEVEKSCKSMMKSIDKINNQK